MAPKREPFFTSQKRCRSLAAGTVLLGVLLCAEYARPARAENLESLDRGRKHANEKAMWDEVYRIVQNHFQGRRTDPGLKEATAREREARGDALAGLHDAVADLGSGDAETRERAQETIIDLGETFADDVAVQVAATKNLEVKTRLLEVLETWRRRAYQKDQTRQDPNFEYWRPYAEPAEVARSGGTESPWALLVRYSASYGTTSSGNFSGGFFDQ